MSNLLVNSYILVNFLSNVYYFRLCAYENKCSCLNNLFLLWRVQAGNPRGQDLWGLQNPIYSKLLTLLTVKRLALSSPTSQSKEWTCLARLVKSKERTSSARRSQPPICCAARNAVSCHLWISKTRTSFSYRKEASLWRYTSVQLFEPEDNFFDCDESLVKDQN